MERGNSALPKIHGSDQLPSQTVAFPFLFTGDVDSSFSPLWPSTVFLCYFLISAILVYWVCWKIASIVWVLWQKRQAECNTESSATCLYVNRSPFPAVLKVLPPPSIISTLYSFCFCTSSLSTAGIQLIQSGHIGKALEYSLHLVDLRLGSVTEQFTQHSVMCFTHWMKKKLFPLK